MPPSKKSPQKKSKPPEPSPARPESSPEVTPPKHEETKREKGALEKFRRRAAERPEAPRVKIEKKDQVVSISVHHADVGVGYALLSEAAGTADFDFIYGMLNQLTNAAQRRGKVSEEDVNFLVSVIKDIKPRDQLESMLAAQMAVVHEAIMTFACRLGNVDNIRQQDSALNAFIKLTRTYTTQLEALKRYRTSGEQKVTVQHVSVGEGGQAIVGNVTTQSARAPSNSQEAKAAPALTRSAEPPMPLIGEAEATPIQNSKSSKNGRGSST